MEHDGIRWGYIGAAARVRQQLEAEAKAASGDSLSEPATPSGALAVGTCSGQLSDYEKALLENARLKLEAGRVESAARSVIRSARWASRGQDLVLRDALLELAREVGEPLNTAD